MEKKFYSVNEFYDLFGGSVTKSFIYKMIDNGEVPGRRFGNKILIQAEWVNAFINTPCARISKVRKRRRRTNHG